MINSILDIMYLEMPSGSRGFAVLVFSNVGLKVTSCCFDWVLENFSTNWY